MKQIELEKGGKMKICPNCNQEWKNFPERPLSVKEIIHSLFKFNFRGEYLYICNPVTNQLVYPDTFHSYRGTYQDLAVGSGSQPITIATFIQRLLDAASSTYEGWKGGSYTMNLDTPVWFAEEGEASSLGVTKVDYVNNKFMLIVTNFDRE